MMNSRLIRGSRVSSCAMFRNTGRLVDIATILGATRPATIMVSHSQPQHQLEQRRTVVFGTRFLKTNKNGKKKPQQLQQQALKDKSKSRNKDNNDSDRKQMVKILHEQKKQERFFKEINIKEQKELGNLKHQLKFLEQFTNSVEQIIKQKKDHSAVQEVKKELELDDLVDDDDDVQADAEAIFNALMIDDGTSKSSDNLQIGGSSDSTSLQSLNVYNELKTFESDPLSLFPKVKPHVNLPLSILEKLDDETTKFIAVKQDENWIPVINHIYQSDEGLSGVNSYEANMLIKSIPKQQRPLVISQIHQMLSKEDLLTDVRTYNTLMATYNLVNVKESLPIIEKLYSDMIAGEIKPNLTTYGIMIHLYSKHKDITKIRQMTQLITENGLKPSMEIYTSILQLYVRLNQYELALDTFQTMKFMSLDTSPSSKTYSSMILMDVLNNNIEHGMSLYEEMKSPAYLKKNKKDSIEGIKVEDQALLALAKGCTTRPGLIDKGWQFILEYYEEGYSFGKRVIETMMCLALKNSDLNLVRALYVGLFDTLTKTKGELTPASGLALKYLFNAYYEFDVTKTQKGREVVDDRVRAIRVRSMEMCNFKFHSEAPPMLPTLELVSDELILSECDAVFNYHLVKFPKLITKEVVEAYLFVYAKRGGSSDDFEKIWDKYTFFKSEGQVTTIEEPGHISDKPEIEEGQKDVEKSQPPAIKLAETLNFKIPRDDRIYNAAMHASRNFKNVKFAQRVWIERGQYRKTAEFQALEPKAQDSQDFKFARSMLSVFVETGNLMDGYQMVLSSQNRFVWSYYHLKSLLSLAETLGYGRIKEELLKVVKRGDKFVRKQTNGLSKR